MRQRTLGLFSLLFVLLVILMTGASRKVEAAATIYIEAQNYEMYQDSDLPVFNTKISVEGDEAFLLDEASNYSIKSLVQDLEAGNGLVLECEAMIDYTEGEDVIDGTYVIDAHLTDEYQKKLEKEWLGVVDIQIVDANLDVVNKLGHWESEQFVDWEGEPLTNRFIEVEGKTYYLDDNGEKLCDTECQIGIQWCTFNKKGILISSKDYIDPEKPMMALTFDDGPGDYTEELLDVLEEYQVHATFFVQGVRIDDSDEAVLDRMLELGCEIGNHSTTHADLTTLTMEGIQQEMDKTDDLVEGLTEELPTVMRPPYGAVDAEVEASVGYPIILWNVDTMDWKTEDSDVVLEHILTTADDGDIVLMHDTKSWSVEAAIDAIPTLIEEGYQLVTVSEMAEASGVDLVDGGRYYSFN